MEKLRNTSQLENEDDDLFSHSERGSSDAGISKDEEVDDEVLMAGRDPLQCFDDSDFEDVFGE